jgi:hypothetical protein
MMEFPRIAIVGFTGSGKTLFATAMAVDANVNEGWDVIANYKINAGTIQHRDFAWIKEHLDEIHDCILILDEFHVGGDAYDFFKSDVRALTDFATQLRKRHVYLVVITQVFDQMASRVRKLIDTTIQITPTDVAGVSEVQVYDMHRAMYDDLIKQFVFDGRKYFGRYNTDEIITDDTGKKKVATKSKKVTKSP